MSMRILYPKLSIAARPVEVEFFEEEQASALAGSILQLVVKSYGALFEGSEGSVPPGAFAAEYNTEEALDRWRQKVVPKVYGDGGTYLGIREPSDTNSLAAVLKVLPGSCFEERFSGMIAVGEILTHPDRQRQGLGSALLHSYFKYAAPPMARLVLEAFDGSPVNRWYRQMDFQDEAPADPLRLGQDLELPTHYMVTTQQAVASNRVDYLENNYPRLQESSLLPG
jgi:GNAT superfamily N-acetyltransferase